MPQTLRFQSVVYVRSHSYTWNRIIETFNNSLIRKTRHLPSTVRDIWVGTGNPAKTGGLYCRVNHPSVDALNNPCMHTDNIRRDLKAEDTMVTKQCAGRQAPLIALTTSWGWMELPGLDLLSRKWRLSQSSEFDRVRGLDEFWTYSLWCDFLMTNVITWFH